MRRNGENLLVLAGADAGAPVEPAGPAGRRAARRARPRWSSTTGSSSARSTPDVEVIGPRGQRRRPPGRRAAGERHRLLPAGHRRCWSPATAAVRRRRDGRDRGPRHRHVRRGARRRSTSGWPARRCSTSSVSRRMGLFVVGRLAGRHGIRVQLRGSPRPAAPQRLRAAIRSTCWPSRSSSGRTTRPRPARVRPAVPPPWAVRPRVRRRSGPATAGSAAPRRRPAPPAGRAPRCRPDRAPAGTPVPPRTCPGAPCRSRAAAEQPPAGPGGTPLPRAPGRGRRPRRGPDADAPAPPGVNGTPDGAPDGRRAARTDRRSATRRRRPAGTARRRPGGGPRRRAAVGAADAGPRRTGGPQPPPAPRGSRSPVPTGGGGSAGGRRAGDGAPPTGQPQPAGRVRCSGRGRSPRPPGGPDAPEPEAGHRLRRSPRLRPHQRGGRTPAPAADRRGPAQPAGTSRPAAGGAARPRRHRPRSLAVAPPTRAGAAARRPRSPTDGGTTRSGLPKRVPQAQLVPGGGRPRAAGARPAAVPRRGARPAVRYHRGVQRGTSAAQ